MGTANILGKNVCTDEICFSFQISKQCELIYPIEAAIWWNKDRMKGKPNGYLELYDGYRFIEGGCSEGVKEDMVDDARTFFRKYRDLFYKAWKDEIDLSEVQDYFRKKCDYNTVVAGV